jgi:putative transposase
MLRVAAILIQLVAETLRWGRLAFRSGRSIKAENLFLRRQLALYIERGVKPRRIDPVTRIALTLLSRFFNWRDALIVVRPKTMMRWHRAGWKLFWRLKSRPGRPQIPQQIQALIRRIANENPLWGEERIANELLLKLGIRVSPRTVSKYLSPHPRGRPRGDLRWSTFLHVHAQGLIACDFFIAVTAVHSQRYPAEGHDSDQPPLRHAYKRVPELADDENGTAVAAAPRSHERRFTGRRAAGAASARRTA